MGTHQARCCLLGAGCTLLAVGTLRESRWCVRTGTVTSYSAAISWRGQGGEGLVEVDAGGGGTSLSAVSRCWGACDHLRARDPTEHRLHFPRCGAGSQWSQWSQWCRVCAGSQWSPCPAPRTQHLPTSCHHTTHADTTGDYNAHFVQYSGKINHKCIIVFLDTVSIAVNIREGVKHVPMQCPIFTFPVIV